jgi:hypothetical protein
MRLTLDQIILPISQYTTAEFLLSCGFYGVSANFTTYALFSRPGDPNVYSNLSLGFRLPKGFTLTPQAQYDYNLNQFISAKCELEKRIFRNGSVNLSYERNFSSNISNTQLGVRYDFAFARTGFLFRQSNNVTTLVESVQGGLVLDAKTHYFSANNSSNVGRGGIVIVPYLDYNCDGHRDKDEPKVFGMEVLMTGGRLEQNKKDSAIRVFNLEPYVSYYVELNHNNFDNISWKIHNPRMVVSIDPNQFKLIEVPIAVVGEVAGMVYLQGNVIKKGLGRMILRFYSADSVLVANTITEPDGYFNYLGLRPGSYFVMPDTNQLHKLNMKVSPASIPFAIHKSKDGDVVDGLEFILRPVIADTISRVDLKTGENDQPQQPIQKKPGDIKSGAPEMKTQGPGKIEQKTDTSGKPEIPTVAPKKPGMPGNNLQDSVKKNESHATWEYFIQVGSFRNESYANAVRKSLSDALDHSVVVVLEDGFYKVRVTSFAEIQEARKFLPKISAEGFTQAYIIKGKKQ